MVNNYIQNAYIPVYQNSITVEFQYQAQSCKQTHNPMSADDYQQLLQALGTFSLRKVGILHQP